MPKFHDIDQGSDEWKKIRIGVFTASNMHKIISPLGKQSTQVEKYITEMLAEIVSGIAEESFTNKHMDRGHEMEQEAADYYSMVTGVELKKVGFCTTDDGIMGCSPDRLIGSEGALEIKTCISRIMIEQYENNTLEQDHRPQTQCTAHVLALKWIDTMLYSPNMKPIIIRSEPMTAYLMDMIRFTKQAEVSLQSRLADLKNGGWVQEDLTRFLRAG